jgi:hypothetical protein
LGFIQSMNDDARNHECEDYPQNIAQKIRSIFRHLWFFVRFSDSAGTNVVSRRFICSPHHSKISNWVLLWYTYTTRGARGNAVGWGTALQVGRSQVRFSMVSLEFFIDIILRPYYGPGVDLASYRNQYQEYFLGVKGGRCVWLTTLPPSCADCLVNLGASYCWNPQGLSRPVMGLLYLFYIH